MTRARLHLVDVEVPLRRPLHTATGSVARRRSIIVGWEAGGTIGWGEAPAFPSGRFGTADAAWNALTSPGSWADELPRTAIAAAAVEAARADHAARTTNQPLHRHLGGSHAAVLARHPIGLFDAADAPDIATAIAAAGVAAIKAKVGPSRDVGPIRALKELLPELDIGVDANGTYRDPDDPVFSRLDEIGVGFIEQPFPADDIESHAALRGRFPMSVCLDETTDDADALATALDRDACDSIAVKVNRHGLTRLDRLRSRASDAGVDIRIGGTFDTSIGRRHLLAAATLPGVIDAEVGPPGAYLEHDIAEYPPVHEGRVTPDDAPGIGTDPDPEALQHLARRETTLELEELTADS